MKIKSTPLSCNQKKSSMYRFSKSSSSRTTGIIIDSGTKLNDNIVPLINWEDIVNKIKKPNIEEIK